jgi:hypothetical protein
VIVLADNVGDAPYDVERNLLHLIVLSAAAYPEPTPNTIHVEALDHARLTLSGRGPRAASKPEPTTRRASPRDGRPGERLTPSP